MKPIMTSNIRSFCIHILHSERRIDPSTKHLQKGCFVERWSEVTICSLLRHFALEDVFYYLEPQTTIFYWMFVETTIPYVKIWNHPIETTIYKWMFGVPGTYIYLLLSDECTSQLSRSVLGLRDRDTIETGATCLTRLDRAPLETAQLDIA